MPSRQKRADEIFAVIAGVPDPKSRVAISGSGIAEPGDLVFFITQNATRKSPDSRGLRVLPAFLAKPLDRFFRRCFGFAEGDLDEWHVGMYLMGRKRRHHQRMNLWMFHSGPGSRTRYGGVGVQLISLSGLVKGPAASRSRMEILQFNGISEEQRSAITEYASRNVGSKFDYSIRRYASLTLILGLPNVLHDPSTFACQSLVVSAYAAAGIHFPHPYKAFPWWNIGRHLGHPLGHPKDRVDPRYPYLMDHHIYRDPRFEVKAAVSCNAQSDRLELETGKLDKYSWNPSLREKYGVE